MEWEAYIHASVYSALICGDIHGTYEMLAHKIDMIGVCTKTYVLDLVGLQIFRPHFLGKPDEFRLDRTDLLFTL